MAGVKWMHSGMPGAPVLNGAVGALIPILDALLVNGFGAKPVATLVISGGVATATVSGGHAFERELVARVAGATVTGGTINGEHRVTETGLNTIQFLTTLPDQTASVSGTIDIAPAGWTKLSGSNKAAYHSTALNASGFWMRVDDQQFGSGVGSYSAGVRGYESMSDVDTGLNPWPTVAQTSVGSWWRKTIYDPNNVSPWFAIADEAAVYVCVSGTGGSNNPNYHQVYGFGDALPTRPGDPYACFNAGMAGQDTGSYVPGPLHVSSSTAAIFVARSFTGFAGPQAVFSVADAFMDGGHRLSGTSGSSFNAGFATYPNRADNGLLLCDISLWEQTTNTHRAKLPGISFVPQRLQALIANGAVVDGSGTKAGRRLRAVRCGHLSDGDPNSVGAVFFDITGPWR